MYGILFCSVRDVIIKTYGKDIWEQIEEFLDINGNELLSNVPYDDQLLYDVLDALIMFRQTGTADSYMEFFGTTFVSYFSAYGFGNMLKVAGRGFSDFLHSIDQLHDSNTFSFPKMRSPLFFVDKEDANGAWLHYKSERRGFNYYVIGQLKECAKLFYKITVEVRIDRDLSDEKYNHVVFRIDFDNKEYVRRTQEQTQKVLVDTAMHNVSGEAFFKLFPFAIGIDKDLKVKFAGSALNQLFADKICDRNVYEVFRLVRPRGKMDWDTLVVEADSVIFMLENLMPLKVQNKQYTRHQRTSNVIVVTRPPSANVAASDTATVSNATNSDASTKEPTTTRTATTATTTATDTTTATTLSLPTSAPSTLEPHAVPHPAAPAPTPEPAPQPAKLKLKGQMKMVPDLEMMLFLCHPVLSTIDEMEAVGLYLTDLNKFDDSASMLVRDSLHNTRLQRAFDAQQAWTEKLQATKSQLNAWKRKSTKLLHSMLPARIAYKIENGVTPNSICETFSQVTILFVNTADFASLVEFAEPSELVKFINSTIVVYDKVVASFAGVNKIETKADGSYMVAAGLDKGDRRGSLGGYSVISGRMSAMSSSPCTPNPADEEEEIVRRDFPEYNQVELVCALALDIVASIRDLHNPFGRTADDHLKVKCGFHTGSIVAGIVGTSNIQFCMFGDTVNTAARMSTNSLPSRVSFSQASYNYLEKSEFFDTEFRGNITMKGKGSMRTYWLTGRKQDVDSRGESNSN